MKRAADGAELLPDGAFLDTVLAQRIVWVLTGLIDVENAVAADPLLDLAKTDHYSGEARCDVEGCWRCLRGASRRWVLS